MAALCRLDVGAPLVPDDAVRWAMMKASYTAVPDVSVTASPTGEEGWSASPLILLPLLLLALAFGIAGERFLGRFMEPVSHDDRASRDEIAEIVGDAGPGRFPPGSGWSATE